MQTVIDTLRELGQGQRVRLRFADDSTLDLRVNQMEYVPDDCLRLEISGGPGDRGRYQAEAHVEDGTWTPLELRRYDRASGAWSSLQDVSEVAPLDMYRTMRSGDMEAQANTGTEPPTPRK